MKRACVLDPNGHLTLQSIKSYNPRTRCTVGETFMNKLCLILTMPRARARESNVRKIRKIFRKSQTFFPAANPRVAKNEVKMNLKIVSALSNIKYIFTPLSKKTDSLFVIIINISRRKDPELFSKKYSVNVLVLLEYKSRNCNCLRQLKFSWEAPQTEVRVVLWLAYVKDIFRVSINSRFYLVTAILMAHLTVSPYNACVVF